MVNISLSGEDIFLLTNRNYYVIDALYVDKLRERHSEIDWTNAENSIRNTIFPFSDAPFAIISFQQTNRNICAFPLNKIKKNPGDKIDEKSFSTDTGLILFIAQLILRDFIAHFNYAIFVEDIEGLGVQKWARIQRRYGDNECAAILSQGVYGNSEFDGSGMFRIEA
ncbi:MAG: hypothetical protein H7Y31_17495 [Chitinophagaceae bacterium]|nr:hypothetical protein [Chitinophagaceae bacterium]